MTVTSNKLIQNIYLRKNTLHILITIGSKPALLRSSDTCYELCFKRSQRGIETWTPEKYYATLASAFTSILEMKIRASTATSIAELKTVIENSHRDLRSEYSLEHRIGEATPG
jgi:hypothetical protein